MSFKTSNLDVLSLTFYKMYVFNSLFYGLYKNKNTDIIPVFLALSSFLFFIEALYLQGLQQCFKKNEFKN